MSEHMPITIHVTETHHCGQVFEQVISLKGDDLFSFGFSLDPFHPFDPLEPSAAFVLPEPIEQQVTLTGHVAQVDLSGVEMRDGAIRCMKCGEDILFRGQQSTPASGESAQPAHGGQQ